LQESAEELKKCLLDDYFQSPFVLVFCNKQDLPMALPVAEIARMMDLPQSVVSYFQGCCATTGDGLLEGLDWLASALGALVK